MVEVVLEVERALYMVRAGISKVRLGDRPSEPSLQKMVNQADGFWTAYAGASAASGDVLTLLKPCSPGVQPM